MDLASVKEPRSVAPEKQSEQEQLESLHYHLELSIVWYHPLGVGALLHWGFRSGEGLESVARAPSCGRKMTPSDPHSVDGRS